MIATEDRLRAAMLAAADTVPPGSAPPLRLPAEPDRQRPGRRRRWLRAMTPLAAAAAVAGVVIASLALTSGTPAPRGGGERSAAASALRTVPPYYVALPWSTGQTQHAVIRATTTGAVLATVKPPRPYGTFKFVTGAADDRTFVLAAQRWWHIGSGTPGLPAENRDNTTPVVFFLLRYDPGTRTARLTRLSHLAGPQASQLAGIALSPDGTRLALAVDHAQVEVATLATGSARHWAWTGSAHSTGVWVGNDKPSGQALSWAADGRTLAFPLTTQAGGSTSVRLLDTTTPGGSLQSARRSVTFVGHGHVKPGPVGNVLITPDGRKIVTVAQAPQPSRFQVSEYSARSGLPAGARRLPNGGMPDDVLWSDPSGRTLIIFASPSAKVAQSVAGVLHGQLFTPLPGAPLNTSNVAW